MAKLKCFQGNLDGRRHGLVLASSQIKAANIVGCGVASFRDYWSEMPKFPSQGLEAEILYTQPSGNAVVLSIPMLIASESAL